MSPAERQLLATLELVRDLEEEHSPLIWRLTR